LSLGRLRPRIADVAQARCQPTFISGTFEQMKDAAAALLKGDPSRWGVIKESVKTKMQEFLPHQSGPSGS
jgi:pyruvate dehydrogenase (quinone)